MGTWRNWRVEKTSGRRRDTAMTSQPSSRNLSTAAAPTRPLAPAIRTVLAMTSPSLDRTPRRSARRPYQGRPGASAGASRGREGVASADDVVVEAEEVVRVVLLFEGP